MPLRRMTVQELAEACGLSRNTVSKVLNSKGNVPETTRQAVLKKAQELGFFQFTSEPQGKSAPVRQSVALLTCKIPTDDHFGVRFIPAFAEYLSRAGYTLMMYDLTEEELREKKLPENISLEQTAAIIAMELFDREYMRMLNSLGLPTLFVDKFSGSSMTIMESDWITMENFASSVAITMHLIEQGAKRIGFVGDPEHCNSFHERWLALNLTLQEKGMLIDPSLCVCDPDDSPYYDVNWVRNKLLSLPGLPDAFFCANDFLAIQVITALKQMGIAIPQQVMVSGFDGAPQSSVIEPALTTAEIPVADMGRIAGDTLITRIQNPARVFSCIYVKTTPVFRASTDRLHKE